MIRMIVLLSVTLIWSNMKALASVNIEYKGDDSTFVQYAKTILNQRLAVLSDAKTETNLTISFNVSENFSRLGNEGYALDVKEGNVVISASKGQGVLYGSIAFIEWIMRNTSPYLIDSNQIDIDFYVQLGQAADFLNNLPAYSIESKPFYNLRGMQCANFALGVADLIDTDKADKFACMVSNLPGGFKTSADEWKKTCDWLARHKMNFLSNWPYS
ncbi:MAG: glycoside hydrolase family 20 zincin-like fold domain-containing protein, partial [Phycisphaerales bacterium]